MSGSGNLVNLIKEIAVGAVSASEPVQIVYGVVVSESPLKIKIDSNYVLTEEFLDLSINVTDHEVMMKVDEETEIDKSIGTSHYHPGTGFNVPNIDTSHKHRYKGKKKYTVLNGLKVGETVLLMQVQGGQKYVVMDRVIRRGGDGSDYPEFVLNKSYSLTLDDEVDSYIYKFCPTKTRNYVFSLSPYGNSLVYKTSPNGSEVENISAQIELYDDISLAAPVAVGVWNVRMLMTEGETYYIKFTEKENG